MWNRSCTVVQWIPGHLTAIPGNEAADQEARIGADLSAEGMILLDLYEHYYK